MQGAEGQRAEEQKGKVDDIWPLRLFVLSSSILVVRYEVFCDGLIQVRIPFVGTTWRATKLPIQNRLPKIQNGLMIRCRDGRMLRRQFLGLRRAERRLPQRCSRSRLPE